MNEINIKKCGVVTCPGCNSSCDRAKIFESIRDKLQGIVDIELHKNNETYDFYLCIYGCTEKCQTKKSVQRMSLIAVTDLQEAENAVNYLKNIAINLNRSS